MKTVRTAVEALIYIPIAILLALPLGLTILWDVWKALKDPDNSR